MTMTHPLPQFRRDQWVDLNGTWKFCFDDDAAGVANDWINGLPDAKRINVPFTYETKASGINDQTQHQCIWYEKTLSLTAEQLSQHVYLNFGGVDYHCAVYLNGVLVGTHSGGYTHFNFDITDAVTVGDNQLVVRVTDSKSVSQPRGKQRWRDENFECWYEQTTGIWKPVWLEFTNQVHITHLKLTPTPSTESLTVVATTNLVDEVGDAYTLQATITRDGQPLRQATTTLTGSTATLTMNAETANEPAPWSLQRWSPETPTLYDLDITLSHDGVVCDLVHSYFGMRDIRIQGHQVLLNGHQLYQRLVLDQNYWPDSGLTPKTTDEMAKDIELIKGFGYNGVRMHMTVADPRFLALCDQMGLLVWSEMPATFTFNDQAVTTFTEEWLTVVQQNYNHPAIITWVPFNESWGVADIATDAKQQAFTEGIYYLTKAYDPMRPVVTNDGWEHTCSDIITLHDYEADGEKLYARYHDQAALMSGEYQHNGDKYPMASGFAYHGQPVIISEFGGIAFNDGRGWGYGEQVASDEDFLTRFDKLHQAIQDIPFISGYCYTQLTDVSQEVNGLLTMDRKPKLPVERIKAVNERRR
ncbi:glycoside hydrolase family 2 protein [Lacticaseibacillus sp. GG6-2]